MRDYYMKNRKGGPLIITFPEFGGVLCGSERNLFLHFIRKGEENEKNTNCSRRYEGHEERILDVRKFVQLYES